MYLLLILVICPVLEAQTYPGASQSAVCFSDIAFANDVFSIINNPAGNALINWREAGVFYSPSPFGLKELATASIAYVEPVSFGSITGAYSAYGYKLYKENRFLLSFSTEAVNNVYLGITGCYHLVNVANYGSAAAVCFDVGLMTNLNREFKFAFSISNLNHSSLADEPDQIPMVFKSGITYNYSNIFLIHLSLQKELRYNFSFSGGFEYRILDVLNLRSGFSNYPVKYSAGAGIKVYHFRFDYTLTSHPELGFSHQFGTVISFRDLMED